MSKKPDFTPMEKEFIAKRRHAKVDVADILVELISVFGVKRTLEDLSESKKTDLPDVKRTILNEDVVRYILGLAVDRINDEDISELAEFMFGAKLSKAHINDALNAAQLMSGVLALREVVYLKRRAMEGATNKVIATELNDIFKKKYKPDFIAEERARLALPMADAKKIVDATILSGKGSFTQAAAPIPRVVATAAALRPAPSSAIVTPLVPTNDHKIAAARAGDASAKAVFAEPKKIKISFTPVPVKKPKEGETYIVSGIGAMTCEEIETDTIAGIKMKIAVLVETHTNGKPVSKLVQVKKWDKESIREPAHPRIMDKILDKLENGLSDIRYVHENVKSRVKFLEGKIHSRDITVVADLLCHLYGHSGRKEISATDFDYKERAIKIIASEYAQAKGVDYKKAFALVNEKIDTAAAARRAAQNYEMTPRPAVL